jgi:hypothetical protein
MTELEDLIDTFLDMMRVIVPPFPDGEDGVFPFGSCVGVSAFLIPFVRLARPADQQSFVVIGKFDGKVHAWIECWDADCDFYVDATVWQFDLEAPRVVKTVDTQRYEQSVWLNYDEEIGLREHAEVGYQSLSTRDGKRLLHGC